MLSSNYYTFIKLGLVILCSLGGLEVMAQPIIHPTTGTSTTTISCGVTYNYYDSGNSGGDYSDGESGVLVFSPSDPGQSVQIDFTAGAFNIEQDGSGCYDYVRVYNGSSTGAPVIGTYCSGSAPAGPIKASLNGSLTVRFYSDGSVTEGGWNALVTCETTDPATVNMPTGTNLVNACTGSFFDSGGSGSYYSNGQSRILTIAPGNEVTMTFSYFNIEPHSSCGYDFLRIYDGPDNTYPIIGTYCGTNSPGTVTSTNGALTFYFDSDSYDTYPGWEATWNCCSVNAGTANVSPSTMCTSGNVNLSLSGQDAGTSVQWQSSPDGVTWSNIAGATSASVTVLASSTTHYRAQVTDGCSVYSVSGSVTVGGIPVPTNYYVNDNSTSGDVYCTNVGNAANNGRNPCSPKTSLQDIFDTYNIEPGDTIFVDAGTYTMGVNITNSSDQGSAANDVVIIGAGKTLTHITAPTNDDNFYFDNVHYFLVKDMHLISSQPNNYNYFIFEGNDHLIDNCHLEHSANTNIYMNEAGNTYDIDDNAVANCEIENSSSAGYNIWIRGDADNDTIRNNIITSTGTGGAKAVVLNDYATGLHDGWPTSIHMYDNQVTADDYGFYGSSVDGNAMELYDIHDNGFYIVSSDRSDGAAIWLDEHGLSSSDVSNIYNNIISGGKNGIYLSSGVDYIHFYNNFICHSQYGIYVSADNSDDNDYQHNSIYTTRNCLYFAADSKAYSRVRNNILYTTSNSTYACLYAGNTTSTFVACDYNLYYAPNGANIAREGATNYTLVGWQGTNHHDGTGNGDNNSMVTNPSFNNPASCQLDLTGNYQDGISIGNISNDLFGTGRTHPTIGAWEEGSTLPVAISSISLQCEDNNVSIQWSTLSEQNNNLFTIEGSNDALNYSDLGQLSGAGNSSSTLHYSFKFDNSELDYKYIRVYQYDFNGEKHLLKNLIVDCSEKETFEVISLYPNPAGEEVTVALKSSVSGSYSLMLYDVEGRVVYSDFSIYDKGLNHYALDLSNVAKGVYSVVIINEYGLRTVKKLIRY